MKNILVLGATSAIAQAVCRQTVSPTARFWLLGRSDDRLRIVAADLLARGAADASFRTLPANDFPALQSAVEEAFNAFGRFDLFLAAQGSLPDQDAMEIQVQSLEEFFHANVVTVMQVSLLVAARFEIQQEGVCVIIGSVAGDRGRRGNYVYGSAKAALDVFCEGLRQRLSPFSTVVLVKPGPVDTPMTAHLKKGALFASPEKVAADILAAVKRKGAVVYSPFYWKWIIAVIKLAPRSIVKKLRA